MTYANTGPASCGEAVVDGDSILAVFCVVAAIRTDLSPEEARLICRYEASQSSYGCVGELLAAQTIQGGTQ
jgi:hypothetical protein